MSGCIRCEKTVAGEAGAVAACGTWAGDFDNLASRRIRFWQLVLCSDCMLDGFVDSSTPEVDNSYEMMQLAPIALVFGVLAIWIMSDPEYSSGNAFEEMALGAMLFGGYLFGVFGGWYYGLRFYWLRRKQRRQQAETWTEEQVFTTYRSEAHRIRSALVKIHQSESEPEEAEQLKALTTAFDLPMPKGVGDPKWMIVGLDSSVATLKQSLSEDPDSWREAITIANQEGQR